MQTKRKLVYIWPLCTRIVHWVIALSFLLSFFTAFFHQYFMLHIAFGYVFGLMLVFRLIWGFLGPDYATFKRFILDFKSLVFYFQEKWHNRWRKIHCGHNAASSWFTLIVLAFGFGIFLSGIILYGTQEASGPLASLNVRYFSWSFLLQNIHTYLSYFVFVWVCVHIIGVFIEQFYHKTDMVFAMILGYKRCDGDDTQLSSKQRIMAYIALVGVVSLFYVVMYASTFLTQTIFQKRDYKHENFSFYEKCGSCHKQYPPFMLPSASWETMMQGLSNHFGEAISEHNISKNEQSSIRAYLVANSAESSTQKIAFKTLQSLGDMRPLSITKSPYWRDAHHDLKAFVFQNPNIKDRSNCFACHAHFEEGLFENRFIHLP